MPKSDSESQRAYDRSLDEHFQHFKSRTHFTAPSNLLPVFDEVMKVAFYCGFTSAVRTIALMQEAHLGPAEFSAIANCWLDDFNELGQEPEP